MKSHLKRIAMPKSWVIGKKKGLTWIIRPRPGMHSFNEAVPLAVLLRDILKLAETMREVNNILLKKQILVDGKRRTDKKFPVGLMDVVSIPEIKENFRIILDRQGKIDLVKINDVESKIKLCKIIGKTQIGKKVQLNLSDGRNLLVDKDTYKIKDTVVIEIPEQKIKDHIKFEKNAVVYITSGKQVGKVGHLKEIKEKTAIINTKDGEFETLKDYCFVIGKEKPLIKLEK